MRLTDKYRPRRLDDVVGQPAVQKLQRWADCPRPECFLLHGDPGTGKTSSAEAVANEIGCVDEWHGRETVVSADVTIDYCRTLFERQLRMKPMANDWRCVIVEELEAVPSRAVSRYLKVALERLPDKCVVVATSNDLSGIEPALLERFRLLEFDGSATFGKRFRDHLRNVWEREGKGTLPTSAQTWGHNGHVSLRKALNDMEDCLAGELTTETKPSLLVR